MDNPAKNNPSLPQAAKTFPKKVFVNWLRFRRKAADEWFPEWRNVTPKERRIPFLDLAARLAAGMN